MASSLKIYVSGGLDQQKGKDVHNTYKDETAL